MKAQLDRPTENLWEKQWVQQWGGISLILLLAVGLYLHQIAAESLWRDEVFSIDGVVTGKGLPPHNKIRPLYYMLLWVWMQFSVSLAWLRSLSVLFGLGSIFLTYQLGKKLANQATGYIAALLLTLSPLMINHAQEVRMYMLSTCLGLGGSLALAAFLKKSTGRAIATWGSLRVLAILSTPLNVLLLAADAILMMGQHRGKLAASGLRKWFIGVAVLAVPTLWAMSTRLPEFLGDRVGGGRPGLRAIVGVLTQFLIWPVELPLENLAWLYRHLLNACAMSILLLVIVALLHRQRTVQLFWAATWAFIPIAILFVLAQFSSGVWYGEGTIRYVLMSAPYLMILVAAGFVYVWSWNRIVAVVVGILYAVTVSIALVSYYTLPYRPDWGGLVQAINRQEQPGDVIALVMGPPREVLEYYYQGSNAIYELNPREQSYEARVAETWKGLPVQPYPQDETRYWLVAEFKEFDIDSAKRKTIEKERQIFHDAVQQQFKVLSTQKFSNGLELFEVMR
jgi:hypothetical protein